jgi:capsular polysaccharide transport system permease protein
MTTVQNPSMLTGLKIQARVVGALLLREVITRYGRHGIGALWLVVEPMMFTLGIASLWYFSNLHVYSSVPIIAFAITGYSSVLVWRNSANRSTKAIEVNLSLMYHRNVKVMDIILARILLEIGGGTASLIILSVLFAALNAMAWPDDILLVIGGWLLLCWFAVALGMIVGAVTEFSDTFERVWHVLAYLLFPLSGAVYMVSWLPKTIQDKALLLPMVHGVEMIRHGYFGQLVQTHENPVYFASVNMVLTLLGLFLMRQAGYRVTPE